MCVRSLLLPCRIGMRECKIIAKIENMEGLVNYREIMDECDVMLLSRGSMGNCVDPEKMFLAQKMLLRVSELVQRQMDRLSAIWIYRSRPAQSLSSSRLLLLLRSCAGMLGACPCLCAACERSAEVCVCAVSCCAVYCVVCHRSATCLASPST